MSRRNVTNRFGLDARWFQVLDELRSSDRLDPKDLIEAAWAQGMSVRWQDLISILRHDTTGAILPPEFVLNFLDRLLSQHSIERALDPWANAGIMLTALLEQGVAKTGVGIVASAGDLFVAEAISGNLSAEWRLGNMASGDDPPLIDSFDLIVSIPPFNLPMRVEELEVSGSVVTVRDSASHLLILRSCLRLDDTGRAIFLVPNSFLTSRDENDSVLSRLPDFGLYLNTVLSLPEGTLTPWTNIPSNLIFISRNERSQLFVGRLDPSMDIQALVENLSEHKAGPIRELGALVDASSFRSWQTFVLDQEIKEIGSRNRLSSMRLEEVVAEIFFADRSKNDSFSPTENSVYLPRIGSSPAVTNIDELRIKPENYAQLVIRPEIAFAEYIANYFNSELGQKVRERWASGFIPKLNKSTLRRMPVFLPTPETQVAVVDTSRTIRELRIQLDELERKLWAQPRRVQGIRRDLKSLTEENSIESWMASLPFPLASILRRYHASADVRARTEYLFHFFEATAQFICCVILSAFRSNPAFYDQRRARWADSGGTHRAPSAWTRSEFGSWVVLGKRLAKFTREMLSDKDQVPFCLSLFKTRSFDLPTALSYKDLFEALEAAKNLRNDKAHSGEAGDLQLTRRLTMLEGELTRVHKALGYAFDGWLLVRPGFGRKRDGIHYYTVENLMGSDAIFMEIRDVRTITDMEDGRIFLLDQAVGDPLEMLPLFRMMPSPSSSENACYFYNRIERSGVRWVSYHFEQDPEIVAPDPDLIEVTRELSL